MSEPLYIDKTDGKPVYLIVSPFGCTTTKNPEFHEKVTLVTLWIILAGISIGAPLMMITLLGGGFG